MPFSWLVASLFALGTAVDAARTLKKPNILLFFPDEWRYDWGGTHNNPYYNSTTLPLRTPNFDWVAKTGTRFTHAWVGAPVCAPSRACLASGRQYDEQDLPDNFHNDYNVSLTTFYKLLRDSGGGPGLNGNFHTAVLGFSLPIQMDLSLMHIALYDDVQLAIVPGRSYAIPDPMPLPDAAYQDNWIGKQAVALLKRKPADMVSTTPAATVAMGRQNYAAKIERLDYWLGQYIHLLN
eukprot:gene8181-14366_t